MTVAAAVICQRWRLRLAPGVPVRAVARATVQLDPGQWRKLKDREITFSAVAPAKLEADHGEPAVRSVNGVGELDSTGRGPLEFKGGFRL
ncbi:hypothetical protein [Streptomyces sp. AP-93]|uniref:hypothetical protein n=1 Tax=Streptomyces sp. AP-93 TaxID=2929048 RepID=UPI001FB02032|nr:hypothetical protein [Streptomyces sp. AP-93]MCJ0875155.1 hypothetical protein [Streptomyces sp. AP-93]